MRPLAKWLLRELLLIFPCRPDPTGGDRMKGKRADHVIYDEVTGNLHALAYHDDPAREAITAELLRLTLHGKPDRPELLLDIDTLQG